MEPDKENRFIEVSNRRSTKDAPPPPQSNPHVEIMMHRLIDMMQRLMLGREESDWKTDSMFEELNNAFNILFSTVKKLEAQVTQYDEKVKQLLILWSRSNKNWNQHLTRKPAHDPPPADKEPQGNIRALIHEDERETSQLRSLQKKSDPGQFVVPCSVNGIDFKDSMCDSGSSINLMPKEVAVRLGLTNLQPSGIILALADSSTTIPIGMVTDLNVRIGNCLVPTDFQVVEMSKEDEVPLILGRPFMATAGAVMDLPRRRISFTNIDEEVFYDISSRSEPTECASCVWTVKTKNSQPAPSASLQPQQSKSKVDSRTRPQSRPVPGPPLQKSNDQAPSASKRPPKGKPMHNQKPQKPAAPQHSPQHFAQISIPIPEEYHCLEINAIRAKLLATMDLFPTVQSWELKGAKMIGSRQRHQSLHAKPSGAKGDPPDL